jgi:hypothetical protein
MMAFPFAQGYGARIDDEWFRVAPSREQPLRYYTRDSLAERQDDTGSTAENVLDVGHAWARTQWDGGEGLDWDPRQFTYLQSQAALDKIRFWDSCNVDISRSESGEVYSLELSHIFKQWVEADANSKVLDSNGGRVWRVTDTGTVTTFEAFDNWGDVAPVITEGEGDQAAPSDIAVAANGEMMAVLVDGKIYSYNGTDVDALTAGDLEVPDRVFYAKGRFLTTGPLSGHTPASEEASHTLTERMAEHQWVGGDGAQNALLVDSARGAFFSVVDGGSAIVAACEDGTLRTYTSDENGILVIASRTDMPKGEFPVLLGSNAGVLLILTVEARDNSTTHTVRLYQAEVLDARFDHTIGNMQLRKEWVNLDYDWTDPQWRMSYTRDEIYFAIPEVGETFLWRFDVVTSGLSRHVTIIDDMKRVISWNGELGLYGAAGVGLYREDADVAPDGWIIGPNITFGLNTPINWVAIVVEVSNVDDPAAEVELFRSSDPEGILDYQDPSWVLTYRVETSVDSGGEIPIVGVQSRTLALQARLIRGSDPTASPKVTRIATRGLPAHRDWIVELPVNISDHIEVPHRLPVHIPNYGDEVHENILDLQGQHVELEVLDPPLVFRGVIDAILEPVSYISDRGSAGRYAVLQLRGAREVELFVPIGGAGTGVFTTGIGTVGIGQSGA